MQISWKKYRLDLDDFTISKGTFSYRNCLVIQLRQQGKIGLGEATEISYYDIDLNHYIDLLNNNINKLQALQIDTPSNFYQKIKEILGPHPFLLSAFDCAAYDLYGKLQKSPVRDLLPLSQGNEPPPLSTFTLGIDTVEKTIARIKQNPWPFYKIKLGGPHDIEILQAVRKETDALVCVDANGGWTDQDVDNLLEACHDTNIQFIEQPFPISRAELSCMLKSRTNIPLIADESCQTTEDVSTSAECFDGINIKLMKCGGLTPAIQMIREAQTLGLQIMVGCMTESSIGISAAAQLLPWVDFADLDGALLIKNNFATGVTLNYGQVQLSDAPGLGCHLIESIN